MRFTRPWAAQRKLTDATTALVSGSAEGAYGVALRAALPTVQQATGINFSEHVVLATMFTTESVRDDTIAVAQVGARGTVANRWRATDGSEASRTTPGDNRLRFVGTVPCRPSTGARMGSGTTRTTHP